MNRFEPHVSPSAVCLDLETATAIENHWRLRRIEEIAGTTHPCPRREQEATFGVTQADWITEIKRLETPRAYGSPTPYVALVVERPAIGVEVQIKIG